MLFLKQYTSHQFDLLVGYKDSSEDAFSLRPKSAYNFFGLVYCFIVLLRVCLVSGTTQYIHTPMAQ